MFSSRTGPMGCKYVETCTIDPINIQSDEQDDKTVFVNVDGSYYQSAETIGGQVRVLNKHDYGRLYGFSMKLSILATSLENINPQAADQIKDLKNDKVINFSVIINEADGERNRIDALLRKIYQERSSSITPVEEFIAEIASAVVNKRNPKYSKHLLNIGIREVSHEVQWDRDFCKKLKQQIATLVSSHTDIVVEQVEPSDYPRIKIPYGANLFKVQTGESKIFFDLGQHVTTPVVVYNRDTVD